MLFRSPHCDEATKTPYCPQCNETFFGSSLNPGKREERKNWIYRKELIRQIICYVITFLLPGSGHFIQEKNVQGLIFSFVWIGSLLLFIFNRFLVEAPQYFMNYTSSFHYICFGITALVVYAFAFLTIKGEA